MTVQLRGVLTALATPFTADGSVDEALLRKVVDRSIDGGVHGVVACGSTGEFSAADRRRAPHGGRDRRRPGRGPRAGDRADGRARARPRRSGSPGTRSPSGADVIMPVAPYYEPLSVEETLTYLRAVAGVRRHPGDDLQPARWRPGSTSPPTRWARSPARSRTSATSRTPRSTWPSPPQLIHNHGDVISTFVGWDSLLLAALAEGAAGVMAGTANVVPGRARRRLRRGAGAATSRRPGGRGRGSTRSSTRS